MKLYHYTSLEHLDEILSSNPQKIKLTASNLKKPIAPRIENGNLIDITDSYKPVVWFTSLLDFKKARGAGLSDSNMDKTAAAIMIETDTRKQKFYKWTEWAEQNKIEKEWFELLKETAPLWKYFYVCEKPVIFDNETKIIFRPDVLEQLKNNLQ